MINIVDTQISQAIASPVLLNHDCAVVLVLLPQFVLLILSQVSRFSEGGANLTKKLLSHPGVGHT